MDMPGLSRTIRTLVFYLISLFMALSIGCSQPGGDSSIHGNKVTASTQSQAFSGITVNGTNPDWEWLPMSSGTTAYLMGVWGNSASDVYAVGNENNFRGIILHYDGSVWSTSYSCPVTSSQTLNAIWGSSASDVFAVGHDYTNSQMVILHYDGSTWTRMPTPSRSGVLGAIWGSSGNDVFAVGSGDTILHYDGTEWSIMDSTTSGHHVEAIWGLSGSDVFAPSQGGTCLHYDGHTWSQLKTGTCQTIFSIWGTSDTNVYAVGFNGTVLRYDGATWNFVSYGTASSFLGVWGSSGTDIFAVGSGGVVLHYDGTAWSPETSGTNQTLYGIWGSAEGDVFVVGSNGTILHYGLLPMAAGFKGMPSSGSVPLTVQFTDLSNGKITSWLWDFGDGGTSTERNPSHTYNALGTYTVSLTVTGPQETRTCTKTGYVTVHLPPPDAAFTTSPAYGFAPLAVKFTDGSSGSITSWSWNFGDGTTSTEQSPSHTYTTGGTFNVVLTVTGPGGTDTKSSSITVMKPTIACSPSSITLSCIQGQNSTPGWLELKNTGTGYYHYTIQASQPWIVCSYPEGNVQADTQGVAAVYFTFPTSSLAVGTYSATITITAPEATNNPQSIPVTLTVKEKPIPPTISVDTATLTVSATQGTDADDQSFQIWNAGDGTLNYSLTADAGWITFSQPSGSATGDHSAVSVHFRTSGLAAGEYDQVITVTSTDRDITNSPQSIPVHVTVKSIEAEEKSSGGGGGGGCFMTASSLDGSCHLVALVSLMGTVFTSIARFIMTYYKGQ